MEMFTVLLWKLSSQPSMSGGPATLEFHQQWIQNIEGGHISSEHICFSPCHCFLMQPLLILYTILEESSRDLSIERDVYTLQANVTPSSVRFEHHRIVESGLRRVVQPIPDGY